MPKLYLTLLVSLYEFETIETIRRYISQ